MGVLCQVPVMSTQWLPAQLAAAMACRMVLLGQPFGVGLQGCPDLFSLHLVILPIIMERLEKYPFMQVSPCFSCHGLPVGPVVPLRCWG